MGSPIQAAMFFSQGNSGWSEVLVMNPVPFPDLATAKKEVVKAGGLGQLRTNLLGVGANLIGIRLSKFGVWRDSNYIANQPGQPWSPNWKTYSAPGNTVAVNPWDALAVRLECGDSYRRLVYLSGMPDGQYSQADSSLWSASFTSYFVNYFNYLTGGGGLAQNLYGTMVSSKSVNDPPINNIATIPPNQPSYSVVNGQGLLQLNRTDGLTGITAGAKVRLLGVKGPSGVDLRKWNGVFTAATTQAGTTFQIFTKLSPVVQEFPQLDFSGAYVWLPAPQFQPFTDWDIEQKTHRKRGVAFGTPRGRVRTQA